ncbi:MAG: glutamate--tRNA ligase [Spirochaetes bacterium]|jgi:glutamyl-tRNA synthetase|nr:glutamate--tRNA ligase [Spirochaetota bacterium]
MRVRFAPSPTGFLHIGNARTAVANFIIAKKENASFILRIEDTDMERSTKESERSILEDLRWMGIDWDEGPDRDGGHGPYRQSERFDIYDAYTRKLLESGNAYHCYCTVEELDAMRKACEAAEKPFVYPGKCRNLTAEQAKSFKDAGRRPTVRFRVPDGEIITVRDHIKGTVVFGSENIGGDFIIVRSDGTPIYNYIVIIDDALMKVTHVIRGEDHLPNTPKQILVARALDLPVPEYAHLALVLGPDRSKLSKRHGITSVEMYRKEGYLPEALFNYLAMLGWATETGEEILSLGEIVKQIELSSLSRSAAVFDFQKLRWMNGNYIRGYDLSKITDFFIPHIKDAGYDVDDMPRERLESVISLVRGNCEILSDIGKIIGIFLDDVFLPDEEADGLLREEDSKKIVESAKKIAGSGLDAGNYSSELIKRIKADTSLGGKKLFLPARAIITGRLKGPELDLSLPLIGFERCMKRIDYCHEKYCRQ